MVWPCTVSAGRCLLHEMGSPSLKFNKKKQKTNELTKCQEKKYYISNNICYYIHNTLSIHLPSEFRFLTFAKLRRA